MTARNAVQRLVQEGLVYRTPGRGTFVADRGAHRKTSRLTNFTDEMRRAGRRPSSRVLKRVVRPAGARDARRLQLKPSADVVEVTRIRLADDEPVSIETAVLRGDTAAAVLVADLEAGSLHAALVRAGFTPATGRGTLGSEGASAVDAKLLGVDEGWPLLVERRVIMDAAGVPLESTETRYAAGRYALDVEFAVEPPGSPA
jgi:GntR family transcriptional regulator